MRIKLRIYSLKLSTSRNEGKNWDNRPESLSNSITITEKSASDISKLGAAKRALGIDLEDDVHHPNRDRCPGAII